MKTTTTCSQFVPSSTCLVGDPQPQLAHSLNLTSEAEERPVQHSQLLRPEA
jgi:hypothetical protein